MRGPACSSQPPNSAVARPRKTKNRVNIQPTIEIFQSQGVDVISAMKLMSAGQASDSLIPIAFESGSQNTEKP